MVCGIVQIAVIADRAFLVHFLTCFDSVNTKCQELYYRCGEANSCNRVHWRLDRRILIRVVLGLEWESQRQYRSWAEVWFAPRSLHHVTMHETTRLRPRAPPYVAKEVVPPPIQNEAWP